jgi:catechol 2,3-dioxygenase-like lactoylglutathione lyase family enzyme
MSTPSIFRIFVPVTDFDKAIAFYQRLFDTEGRLIHGGRRYFDCGPVIFAVIENNGTPIGDHIYFSVPNLEAVFTRAKELDCLEDDDVHGAPSGEINVRPWGERSFAFHRTLISYNNAGFGNRELVRRDGGRRSP